MKGALGMEHLFLKRVCGEGLVEPKGTWNLGGGAQMLGTLKNEWKALVTGHLSVRDCMKGTLREGSLTGDRERYVKRGSEMGFCFHRSPTFGEHGGALLS